MYVHKLGGSWLENPFWKKAFLLTDAEQLRKVVRSGLSEIWIDTVRGRDVDHEASQAAREEDLEATMMATAIDPLVLPSAPAGCSLADELERAKRIVAQGRSAMKRMFEDVRLGRAIDAEHCLPLVQDITGSVERNRGALVSLARLKTSDDYTYMHSVAVCALMVALGRQLALSRDEIREAGVAGLVHDLGKALMPAEVLNKSGPLTAAEFAVMRGHPQAGHQMLMETKSFSDAAMDVALHHHEKVNGKGYPHGLAGDGISLLSRMGAVCDVYDAVTSNRCPAGIRRARSARWRSGAARATSTTASSRPS